MEFSANHSTIYSYHDAIVSIWIRLNIVAYFIMGVLYVSRAEYRRAIAKRFFGYKEADPDRIIRERTPFKVKYVYSDILYIGIPHVNFVLGVIYFSVFNDMLKPATVGWALFLWLSTSVSFSVGSHRFYSHHAFKANLFYEIWIMLMNCLIKQHSIIYWSRDHRTHHKFIDTNADPFYTGRGYFHAHIGFLLTEIHPDVIKKGQTIDMKDLSSNKVLAFQRNYLFILQPLIHFIFPWLIPYIFWGEHFWPAYLACVDLPYVISVNMTLLGLSWAHYGGEKTYNKNISAADAGGIRNLILFGAGHHNFHHAFPYDYRSNTRIGCPGSILVTLCSYVGITWDLKTASPQAIERAKLRSAMAPTKNLDY